MAESMEEVWLAQAKSGDQEAFGCLVRAYEKRVFALTRRLCVDPSDAEEAAQDAFLAVWQGLPSFRGEARFSTWLYRLTVNACTDILRRRQRRSGREEYRMALVLREIQQLSYEEIAQATGAKSGTIKSRISRGRGLLRKFLQEHGNLSDFPASNRIEAGKGGRG